MKRYDRKLDGQATSQHDAAFHRFDYLRHRGVAGVVTRIGVGNADERPFQGIIRVAHGLDEGLSDIQGKGVIAVSCQALADAFSFVTHITPRFWLPRTLTQAIVGPFN